MPFALDPQQPGAELDSPRCLITALPLEAFLSFLPLDWWVQITQTSQDFAKISNERRREAAKRRDDMVKEQLRSLKESAYVPEMRRAIQALVKLGSKGVKALIRVLLRDSSSMARILAAEALVAIGSPAAVAAITSALGAEDSFDVRREAAKALAHVGAPEALVAEDALVWRMRNDRDPAVEAAAAGALLALGVQNYTSEAQDRALKILCSGRFGWHRSDAAWALGHGSGATARDALKKATEDSAYCVREAAERALKTVRH